MLREGSLDGDHTCLHEEASAMIVVKNISPQGSMMFVERWWKLAKLLFSTAAKRKEGESQSAGRTSRPRGVADA